MFTPQKTWSGWLSPKPGSGSASGSDPNPKPIGGDSMDQDGVVIDKINNLEKEVSQLLNYYTFYILFFIKFCNLLIL